MSRNFGYGRTDLVSIHDLLCLYCVSGEGYRAGGCVELCGEQVLGVWVREKAGTVAVN
jgi:hypothetical protein